MGLLSALGDAFGRGKSKSKVSRLDVNQRFHVGNAAAAGTTSKVRVVQDKADKKQYALKLIDPAKTDPFRSRFTELSLPCEGEIASQVKHPNVVETIEFGKTTTGEEYLLMELMNGPRLDRLIAADQQLPLERKFPLVAQMASAIQAIHDAGYIHRDICPRNFICDKGLKTIKLFDFGNALPDQPEFRLPRVRTGTPLYMAPELVRRRPTSQRLDVFGFGVSVFHFLTGKHPWGLELSSSKAALTFDTREPIDILTLIPELNPKTAVAIHRCLEADPEKRLPSCKTFSGHSRRTISGCLMSPRGDFAGSWTANQIRIPR